MLSRSWMMRVGCGLLLAGLCGAQALDLAVLVRERSLPPVAMSVREAAIAAEAGARLDHLRLTDLRLHCDTRDTRGGRLYVGAVGGDANSVVVEIDPDDACETGPLDRAGSWRQIPRPLGEDAYGVDIPRLSLFRPHTELLPDLLMYAALSLLGVALVWSGLRRRRSERALWRTADDAPASPVEAQREGDPYRQAQDGRWLLPGPLRPDERWLRRARRRALAGAALGAVMLVTGLLLAASFTRDVIRMRSLWATGEPASELTVEGQGRRGGRPGLIHSEDLVVVYSDASGERYHGSYWRLALLSAIDSKTQPGVKYDREDPGSFVVSWVVEGLWGEVALMLVMLGLVVPSSWILMHAPRRRLRELAEIREVLHSSPEEVILRVAYAQRYEVKGELLSTTYGLRAADGSELTAIFVPPEQPLFLELDESRALGLRRPGRPAQVVVLRDDLAPLVADEVEAERVRLRYRRAGGQRPPT